MDAVRWDWLTRRYGLKRVPETGAELFSAAGEEGCWIDLDPAYLDLAGNEADRGVRCARFGQQGVLARELTLMREAQVVGHHPEMVLAGRYINDGMGAHIAGRLVKGTVRKGFPVVGSPILVMGLVFKENCPDLRSTRVVGIITDLQGYKAQVDVWEPRVDTAEAYEECALDRLEGEP